MDSRWQPWLLRQCQNVMGEAWLVHRLVMGAKSLKIIMILWHSQKTINHYIHLYLTYSSYIYIYVDQL